MGDLTPPTLTASYAISGRRNFSLFLLSSSCDGLISSKFCEKWVLQSPRRLCVYFFSCGRSSYSCTQCNSPNVYKSVNNQTNTSMVTQQQFYGNNCCIVASGLQHLLYILHYKQLKNTCQTAPSSLICILVLDSFSTWVLTPWFKLLLFLYCIDSSTCIDA